MNIDFPVNHLIWVEIAIANTESIGREPAIGMDARARSGQARERRCLAAVAVSERGPTGTGTRGCSPTITLRNATSFLQLVT